MEWGNSGEAVQKEMQGVRRLTFNDDDKKKIVPVVEARKRKNGRGYQGSGNGLRWVIKWQKYVEKIEFVPSESWRKI